MVFVVFMVHDTSLSPYHKYFKGANSAERPDSQLGWPGTTSGCLPRSLALAAASPGSLQLGK